MILYMIFYKTKHPVKKVQKNQINSKNRVVVSYEEDFKHEKNKSSSFSLLSESNKRLFSRLLIIAALDHINKAKVFNY